MRKPWREASGLELPGTMQSIEIIQISSVTHELICVCVCVVYINVCTLKFYHVLSCITTIIKILNCALTIWLPYVIPLLPHIFCTLPLTSSYLLWISVIVLFHNNILRIYNHPWSIADIQQIFMEWMWEQTTKDYQHLQCAWPCKLFARYIWMQEMFEAKVLPLKMTNDWIILDNEGREDL
jgi:hypothetical protein